MTLDRYRGVAERLLDPVVDVADRAGLTPDGVTVIAFALAVAAGGVFVLAAERRVLYLLGAGLVFANGLADLLDGQLARRQNVTSASGDLLDHVLDRYADIVVLAGLAAGVGEYAIGFAAVTGVLMTSYLGTQAEAVGLERVYGGLVGRADRLALVVATAAIAAFVPTAVRGLTVVGWLLVVIAVVGHFTALQRFYHAMRVL